MVDKYLIRRIIALLLLAIVVFSGIKLATNNETHEVIATETENPYKFSKHELPLRDGIYKSTAKGFVNDITVEMIVKNNRISDIEIVDENESKDIAKRALTKIPYEIKTNQTLKVDTVSGATHTSEGIIKAVKDCIRQAGVNPDEY